ncbi:MAG: hypothetical protein Q4D98_14610, partial [Planctomycetia bacterium]|nr:hypothetical protein [Planctomycetia bacterium]
MATPNFEDDFLKSLQSQKPENSEKTEDSQPAGDFFNFLNSDATPASVPEPVEEDSTPQPEETPVEENPFAFLGGDSAPEPAEEGSVPQPEEKPAEENPFAFLGGASAPEPAEEDSVPQPEETPAEENPFAFLGGDSAVPEEKAPAFDLFSTSAENVAVEGDEAENADEPDDGGLSFEPEATEDVGQIMNDWALGEEAGEEPAVEETVEPVAEETAEEVLQEEEAEVEETEEPVE